jgi:hypothetical protein
VFVTIPFDDYVRIQRDILVSAIDSYDKRIDKVVFEIDRVKKIQNRRTSDEKLL